jgi:diguanylate cyclase (GGDEF)-like protein/PAS domain S-box-containing protein
MTRKASPPRRRRAAPGGAEQRLAIEHAAARALAESDSMAQAAPRIIRAICETLRWSCGSRWELDKESDTLFCTETWGPSKAVAAFLQATRKIRQERAPGGLIRRAWLEGEPVWIPDVGDEPSFNRAPLARSAGLHSGFAFPIKAGATVIGVMEFFGREIERPDAELLECVGYVGSQIGQYLQRKQAEAAAALLSVTMDASPDYLYVVDPVQMRFIYVNDAPCKVHGITREQHLRLLPWKLLGVSREQCERAYAEVVAKAGETLTTEVLLSSIHDPTKRGWFELQRRALRVGERWLIVTNSRDVTERKLAQKSAERRGRMFATLSATNEAITRARSPEELYAQVCDAAVHAGGMLTATVLLADPGTQSMKVAAVTGGGKRTLRETTITVDETSPLGHGLIGTAFRSGKPCVSNDFLNDERTVPWRASAEKNGIKSGGAVPFSHGGRTVGVLQLWSGEKRTFDDEALKLLERLAQNISFALDNFVRDAERRTSEAALRASEEKYRAILEDMGEAYYEVDLKGSLVFFNPEFCRLLGYSEAETMGLNYRQYQTPEVSAKVFETFSEVYRTGVPAKSFDWWVMRKDGTNVMTEGSVYLIKNALGEPVGFRGILRDVTERRRSEERIQYLATHDGLTDLPNRVMFSELLHLEIETARRYERRFAVLFIDLDRFKFVNDTLGHAAGDTLLKEMAVRLKDSLRASDVVARLGGDEFVVLLQEAGDASQVAAAARKILSATMKPIEIAGQECRVTASIGICMYPADAADEESLMKNADMAMYLAKEAGKNNYQFYSAEIQSRSIEKMAMETRLRNALARGELSLNYQAKLDLKTEMITGVEALMRWTSPELGSVSPMQFIPVAEETGLIVPLGMWALRTACAQNRAWQREGLPPVCMAVNLSPRQFADPDLVADVTSVLKDTGMAPELLELEITESMVMHDSDRAVKLLGEIKALGVRLAIDDFGTGYSSLAQLKRFPIDTIKVDRSFIREIPNDAEDKAITEAIIAMGRSLSLTVVAEGVETEQQQTFLREHLCDEMQGYYFSKPVPPEQFAELVRNHSRARAAHRTP